MNAKPEMPINKLMKALLLKNRSSLVAAFVWFIFQNVPLHATINVVGYWRMGEGDPGAAAGVTATNATDSVSAKNLKFQGNASYTTNVAASAVAHGLAIPRPSHASLSLHRHQFARCS